MGLYDVLKESLRLYLFDEEAIKSLKKRPEAFGWSFFVIVMAGIAIFLSTLLETLTFEEIFFGLIFTPIAFLIGTVVSFFAYHLLAKAFGGKAKAKEFFKTYANLSVAYWFTFIPILGSVLQFFVIIWSMVVTGFLLHKLHELSVGRSIVVLLIPLVLFIIIFVIVLFYVYGSIEPQYLGPFD
ncbi:MAG: YIP1 family protein [Candidatus Woesearchaeota archaeon]